MLGRFAPLILAPLIASCQPPDYAVRAVFLGNALAFVAADPGEAGATGCWREGVVVDDSLRPAWRFTSPGTGQCRKLLPIVYGRAPEGARSAMDPARLEPGRLYLFVGDATTQLSGAFALTRAGTARIVHNVDPDSPAAAALRQAWWRRPAPAVADGPPSPGTGR